MQEDETLKYVPERKYVKMVMSKGKNGAVGRSRKMYRREQRDAENVPESHGRLKEFLKVQNRDLADSIAECKEKVREVEENESEDMETDDDDGDHADEPGLLESDEEEEEVMNRESDDASDDDIEEFDW